MSRDGQRVFFDSAEVAGGHRHGRGAATSTSASRASPLTSRSAPAAGTGRSPRMFDGASTDGARVFFDTTESLMSTDTDATQDIYAADVSGYPRPEGRDADADVRSFPRYRQCTTPNRTHGPPLASPSCTAPVLESSQLTVGSPDANGQAANASAFCSYEVVVGLPGGADDSDVTFTVSFTDVRVQGSLADYTGQLQARPKIRITDRLNGPAANEPATGTEVELPGDGPLRRDGRRRRSGRRARSRPRFDAVTPGAVPEGKRSIWAARPGARLRRRPGRRSRRPRRTRCSRGRASSFRRRA